VTGRLSFTTQAYAQRFALAEPTNLVLMISQTSHSSKVIVFREDQLSDLQDPGFVPIMEAIPLSNGSITKNDVPAGDYILAAYTTDSNEVSSYISASLFEVKKMLPEEIGLNQSLTTTLEISGAPVLSRSERKTYRFTIYDNSKYSVFGVNEGIDFFILPRDQESAFLNYSQFGYLPEYALLAGRGVHFREINLNPGDYVIALSARDVSINRMVFYLNGYLKDFSVPAPKESLLIRRQSGSMQLVMEVQVGQFYVLKESSDLISWQTVDSFTAEQDSKSIDVPLSKSQNFYKLSPILDVDFGLNNGGFWTQTFGLIPGPWKYSSNNGVWYADGAESGCSGPYWSMLNSPVYTVIEDGNVVIQFEHRYSFESILYDGGQIRVSLNGAEFEPIPADSFSSSGYAEGQIIGLGILNGLRAFNGTSTGYDFNLYLTSIVNLGPYKSGDSIAIQFLGGWDECATGKTPNWVMKSLKSLQLSPY
jgi:hypothetical protein